MGSTFAEIAQADAREWAARVDETLDRLSALLIEGQAVAGAIDAKVGIPSPVGGPPSYPGLHGPVVAVLRARELREALERWRTLKERI